MTLDVDLEGLFLPEGRSPSCAELAAGGVSWLPEMALGQAGLSGQDYIPSVPYFRPPLPLVTASLSELSRSSTPGAYNQPSTRPKGKHTPLEMVLPPSQLKAMLSVLLEQLNIYIDVTFPSPSHPVTL